MRRRRRDRGASGRPPVDRARNTFQKVLFSLMGPAQVGENKEPDGFVADQAALLCHRCGHPWDWHERVTTRNMTYTRCPTPTGGA